VCINQEAENINETIRKTKHDFEVIKKKDKPALKIIPIGLIKKAMVEHKFIKVTESRK